MSGSERLDRIKDSDFGALMAKHKDLESLQKGEVECKRRKPATIQTKQEAFNNYLRLIYRQPPSIRIELDEIQLWCTEEDEKKGREESNINFTTIIETPSTKKSALPPTPAAKKRREKRYPPPKPLPTIRHPTPHVTPSSESAPPSPPLAPPLLTPAPPSPISETPSTQKSPLSPTPATEKLIHPSPKALRPIKHPTPPLSPPSKSAPPSPPLAPPSPSKQPTFLPPPPPSSYLPEFLGQFVDEHWFQKMFPDMNCISHSLGPKEFGVHLLDFMMSCSMTQKNGIMKALLMLIQQEVLDKESISKGLLVCLQNCIHKNMSREEKHFVGELLNLMLLLSPNSSDTIVELLVMLADKQVDLKALVLCVLQRLGVEEARLWLCPELESWNSLTKDQPNQHGSLRDMASHWLLTWTSKYRVHTGCVFLRTEGVQSAFAPVEVLKYFCSVQRAKQPRPPPPPLPEGRKDTIIVPSGLARLKPIQRLGETYSMSRIREPRGHLLPPLPYRPLLMGFTRFLSLPMAHVTLSPFPFSLDFQNFRRPSLHRYFFLEQSYVEYYR
ncbi:uncharacterized protein [Pseudorasbora parva]|uniref:uncharacterized protein isoform X1 n=1 Tax=Pseudorasbora parva TaxID=51549 RepID=UPI00351F62A5